MKFNKIHLLFCFFATFFLCVAQITLATETPHLIVRRAAFDIGSGQIKMQISDVDLTVNKIAKVLLVDAAKVALREDLARSNDGKLSLEIQDKLVDAINALMKKASPFQPAAYHAIATESLRLATNADSLIERIKNETGLSVTIISQQEEGILGFITAVNEIDVNPDQVMSWDFGGGSLQITARDGDRYHVYQSKLGKIPFKNALLQLQGKNGDQISSPNPISKEDAMQAVEFIKQSISDTPIEIRQKLRRPDTIVLGIGIHPLWGMPENTSFGQQRILKEIKSRLNLDDEAIRMKDSICDAYKESAAYVVSNLILAYGFMNAFEIDQVRYVGTPGANAIGTLLTPKYWELSCSSR